MSRPQEPAPASQHVCEHQTLVHGSVVVQSVHSPSDLQIRVQLGFTSQLVVVIHCEQFALGNALEIASQTRLLYLIQFCRPAKQLDCTLKEAAGPLRVVHQHDV